VQSHPIYSLLWCNSGTIELIYNATMQFRTHLFLVGCLFLMIGCASRSTPTPISTPDPLIPFITPTPTLLPDQTAAPTPEIILPTPTPLTYTIVAGDTFGAIADRFGIRLDDLMAANPGVSPNTLSVGITIIIPNAPVSTAMPVPTPAPLLLAEVDCWPTLDGGMWCFVPVTNSTGDLLENLAAQVSLVAADGTVTMSQTALAPLDILPSGKSTALTVFFAPPIAQELVPQVQLTTAIRILTTDTRYAPVVVQNSLVQTDWAGTLARVSGFARLVDGTFTTVRAERVWVAAIAYDASGRVIGTRRWESSSPLTAGTPLPFDFQVASVGPVIDRVDIQVEARP
jgi:hypothetical protein